MERFEVRRDRSTLAICIARGFERAAFRLIVIGFGLLCALQASAQCTLRITAVGPCSATGVPGVPHLGDAEYGVYVNWTVTGTPSAAYSVEFNIGPNQYIWPNFPLSPGNYNGYVKWTMPVDGPIPYSVILDPTNVSGDPTTTGHTATGSFTPTPPTSPFVWFGQQTVNASQTLNLTLTGDATLLDMIFGEPTSETSQQVTSYTPVPGASTVLTTPTGYPASVSQTTNPSGAYAFTQSFSAQEWNYMANQSLVDCTWASLSSLPANIAQYTQPDSACESTNSSITAFVATVLPSNYLTTLTPLQAARKLFQAIAARITYQTPAVQDAVTVLSSGVGDCLGMSDLYIACLRSIGIPARPVCGWTTVELHCWSELYSPTAGWIPQDVTYCNTGCKGALAYYFMIMPDLDNRCIVSRGSDLTIEGTDFISLQVGAFVYYGNAYYTWSTSSTISTSAPNALQTLTVTAPNLIGGTSTNGVLQTSANSGLTASLSSSSSVLTVPNSVTLNPGSSSQSFPITTSAVSASQVVTLTATFGPTSLQTKVTVTPPPTITSFTVASSTIAGGTSVYGDVNLATAAGVNGVAVSITSSSSDIQVPSTVTVPAGYKGASFKITTSDVSAPVTATLTANDGSSPVQTTLNLTATYSVLNVYVSASPVTGGASLTGNVNLTAHAGVGGATITLTSSSSYVQVPASVTVASGYQGAGFKITTSPVGSAITATITATIGTSSMHTTLTLNPSLSLLNASATPSSVVGGGNVTGDVNLTAHAGVGGAVISLSSNSASVQVPATITIASGYQGAQFKITTSPVTTTTQVTITATIGSSSKQILLTLTQ